MSLLQPGQMLGPYRIINQIGQGGMATVYKAYHANMDRYVAIKVLPTLFAHSPEALARFRQEARTIANLEHPHILLVYDAGESDGIAYLVMRYLDAGTLKERLKASTLAVAEIDRIFSRVADALGYAHARGVIHRDIKPANIMLDAQGEVFLTDFGVAKLLESDMKFTASGAVTGTPEYMSPEQAQGEKLDARSDIYALGIVLYEMVTGRLPFSAETPLAVLLKHITEPLPPPSVVKPDIAPAIERVILKALSKNRDDRFVSCADFLSAWKQALSEALQTDEAPTGRAHAAKVTTPSPKAHDRQASVRQPAWTPLIARVWVLIGFGIVFASLGFLFASWLMPPSANQTLAPASTPSLITPITSTPATARPSPTATPIPPRPSPTPDPMVVLLQQVDVAWGRSDWPRVIELLAQARQLDPRRETIADTLYVAYYNYGQALLKQDKKAEAVRQFENALAVKANGAEAQQALLDLKPSPPAPTMFWSEDFALPYLDENRWKADYTYNFLSLNNGVLQLGSSSATFPYVRTTSNPFPGVGDFQLHYRLRYAALGDCGVGFMLTSYVMPSGLSQSSAAEFQRANEQNGLAVGSWQDRNTGMLIWFRAGAERADVRVSSSNTNWHEVKVHSVGRRYMIDFDNQLAYTSQDTTYRPEFIWIGHPAQLDARCAWSRLDIDFIRVETLP